MTRIIIFFILVAIAVYFVWEALALIREGRFKVGRSRTWAIVLALGMIAFMMYRLLIINPIFC